MEALNNNERKVINDIICLAGYLTLFIVYFYIWSNKDKMYFHKNNKINQVIKKGNQG